MKHTILIGLIIGMFLLMITSVIAATPDYTYKLGEDVYLIASCDISGVPCDPSTAACNLTIRDPDNNYIINFQPMTISFGGDINYTLKTNQVTQSGDYPGKINCIDGGQNKTETFILAMTPTGEDVGYGLFLILAIASISILVLGIWAGNEYVGFLAGALFLITGLYSIAYGISNLTDLYTRSIGFVCLGLGLIFMVAAGYKVVEGILGEDKAF